MSEAEAQADEPENLPPGSLGFAQLGADEFALTCDGEELILFDRANAQRLAVLIDLALGSAFSRSLRPGTAQ
jgi:hypothetical protein